MRECLDRIGEREGELRAWTHLDPDEAIAQARERDDEEPRGPLHGLPVGVKNVIDTADMPTSYGSPIYAGRRPARDADCVAWLREQGAVILGKTVTTEFATYEPPPTVNPHDPERTPGGSSSGSAAAVADGMVPLAYGTQTAGSVIRPASFCGVVGFKPSHGWHSTDGIKRLSARLDTLGTFGRTVADAALLAGFERRAAVEPRIAFCRTPWWDAVEAVAVLEARRRPPRPRRARAAAPSSPALAEAQETVMAYDVARNLEPEWRAPPRAALGRDARLHRARPGACGARTPRTAPRWARRARARLAGRARRPRRPARAGGAGRGAAALRGPHRRPASSAARGRCSACPRSACRGSRARRGCRSACSSSGSTRRRCWARRRGWRRRWRRWSCRRPRTSTAAG